MLCIDFSYNENFDDNLNFHRIITEAILDNADSTGIQKFHITTSQLDVKSHYLEFIDQKAVYVYANEKILEDVDIQDHYDWYALIRIYLHK